MILSAVRRCRRFARSLRLVLGLACAGVQAAPLAAAEASAAATYTVTLGGTAIATASIRLNDTGATYTLKIDAKVTGLAQLVASGTVRGSSAGQSTATALVSEKFDLLTRAQGEDFAIAVEYANRNVVAFKVEPPIVNTIGRVALERRHLRNVNDMLAAFVLKGGALDADLCRRKLQIFTGTERFDIAMNFLREETATSPRTGYQGPVVLCSVRYTPISGHYTTSEITSYLAQTGRIVLWYAPLAETGYYIPYRALVTTSVGDLSIVLTDLEQ